MKIKDIKNKLKSEQNSTAVPDVYERVKRAPLNKLLEGETPVRAFQSAMAVRMLAIVSVLFAVMSVAAVAMMFSSSEVSQSPDCYSYIALERGGTVYRIGVLYLADDSIKSIAVEMTDGEIESDPIVSYSSQISDFISPKNGDKVSIGVICSNTPRGRALAEKITSQIEDACKGDVSAHISAACNDLSSIELLRSYIVARGGAVRDDDGAERLISAYDALF